jgi:uncharacterized repeat protein (TIGR03803 family)
MQSGICFVEATLGHIIRGLQQTLIDIADNDADPPRLGLAGKRKRAMGGEGERGNMRYRVLFNTFPLLTCMATQALIGCGGGSGSSGPTTYTLGGTLAGLATNQSVSLQDNGGDTLQLSANGPFSFPVSLDTGSAYAVTVQSHTPAIACSVNNGSGAVGSSNVTGIDVSCTAGTETTLYSFGASATDGEEPYSGLIMDSAGSLYGTTYRGGANSLGTVFKISASGTESVLYSFGASASDGVNPHGGLIMDSAGNLYGTTSSGGASGSDMGTAFKISVSGSESILYSFGVAPDGEEPEAGLIMDSAENLYGTTEAGGVHGGDGTVFKIASGTETVLYSFGASATDGQQPEADLIMDSAGNLYGTTQSGGANGRGTVFKIASGTEAFLYSFGATATDGQQPEADLIMDSAGNLYGTTAGGGANGHGTIFKIGPSGTETILYSFGASATDGQAPFAGLIMDSAGNFYGTTDGGGANGDGTVFKISTSGTETVLYSFGANAIDGQNPTAGLIMDSAGNLYGTTYAGGAKGWGTVFLIN